ncbi:MAG: hypothetical protein IPK79_13005 [Vampirovibrionales bacterium]|nr:hypothetical protein [Vampirovibrionales bacterium]
MSSKGTIECSVEQLSELSVEAWRLGQWLSRLDSQSSIGRHVLRKYERFFQDLGIEVLDMTGKTYDPGMALDIIDSIQDDTLESGIEVIDETIAPIVVYQEQVIRHGQVVTRKRAEVLEQATAEEQ